MSLHRYTLTRGVCATEVSFEITRSLGLFGVKHTIKNLRVEGGCPGGSATLGILLEGMPINKAIDKLKDIQCRGKRSCAGAVALALQRYVNANKSHQ
jgi:uncharacterized protein (TIGR03905 family)